MINTCASSSEEKHRTFNPDTPGSNPGWRTILFEVKIMVISKSAQKVLNKTDKLTVIKLNKALNNIQNNIGHIEPLKQLQKGAEDNLYRYKMEHYRIIFKKTPKELTIKSITTKSNTKLRRTGCK